MRHEPNLRIEQYRVMKGFCRSPAGVNWGAFQVGPLCIISSGTHKPGEVGYPWEHVSVSREDRIPNYEEMQRVKELFWQDEETVVHFHPKLSAYVNCHPRVLHLWRRLDMEYELPPRILLAP